MTTKFHSWPNFTQEEADAVSKILLSNRVNFWTGNEVKKFEKEFADYCDSQFAIAVANGTVALDLALRALQIGEGDEVIVTPRTFIASVSCVVNAGATPVFADVDKNSGNLTAENISKNITDKTKAVICVHLAGMPCDMDPIMELADQHALSIIEDCAQAHGARYKDKPVGSIGHIGAWSFCQDKIMTTGGEGGMVTTNDKDLWDRMWSFKDHGKSYEAVFERDHPPGFRWVHESFGTNYRMTEMQAAIGRIQLGRMPDWHAARERNAKSILNCCMKFSSVLQVQEIPENIEHAWYKLYVYLRPQGLKESWSREKVIEAINSRDVPCFSGSCSEVYMEKAFEGTGLQPEKRLVVAKDLGEVSLMFLVHPTLTNKEIQKTCDVINEVMKLAEK